MLANLKVFSENFYLEYQTHIMKTCYRYFSNFIHNSRRHITLNLVTTTTLLPRNGYCLITLANAHEVIDITVIMKLSAGTESI